MKQIRLYIFFLTLVVIAFGEDRTPFKRYTIEDGLSQNFIYAIAQDAVGVMWFGTKEGLNCFDGYSFRVFRYDAGDTSSLSSNFVNSLYVDNAGTLWVGTWGGGLNKFNHSTLTFQTFRPTAQETENLLFIEKIIGGPNGTLIVSTTQGDIFIFDPTNKKFSPVNYTGTNNTVSVKGLFLEPDTVLWVAAKGEGIFRYSITTGAAKHFTAGSGRYGPASNRLEGINEDRQGRLWFAHQHGFDAYDRKTGIFEHHPIVAGASEWIGMSMKELSNGKYFAHGFSAYGIYDPELKIFHPYSFGKGSSVTFVDHSGVMWISDGGHGILKYNPAVERFNKRPGTMAVEMYRKEFEQLQSFLTIPIAYPPLNQFGIVKDQTGVLWFNKKNGNVYAFDAQKNTLKTFPINDVLHGIKFHYVERIFCDNSNTVWVTSGVEIAKYDRLSGTFVYYNLADYPSNKSLLKNKTEYVAITAVLQDRLGNYWFGTSAMGLIRFNEAQKEMRLYQARERDSLTITNNFVLSVQNDPHDVNILWIGTDGGGLNRFDTKREIVTHRFSVSNGLPNNVIYGILTDSRDLFWISSNFGIFCFDPLTMSVRRRYNAGDGLQNNEFNRFEFYQDEKGKMFFGGIEGWNSFHPGELGMRTFHPNIIFTDLKIVNTSIAYPPSEPLSRSLWQTNSVILQPDQNIVTIEFSSLDYSSPEKNRYKYILEQFDKEWITAGTNHSVTYTNIGPGTYRFRVRGTNSEGVWNDSEAMLEIIVLPPYYRTWWFQLGISIIVIGAITLVVRQRFLIVRREQKLQEEFSRQLIEHQEQDRERIAAELHDSLGQNLLVVKNRAVLGARDIDVKDNTKEHFEYISALVSDTLKEVREISHNLRPYQLDRLGLSEAIVSMAKKITESTSLIIDDRIDDVDNIFPREKEIHIYRIIQESMNNIIKHSGAKHAELFVSRHTNIVSIIVHDNGKGIDEGILQDSKGFGMKGMRERVRLLNGKMNISSAAHKGTTITIELPIA